MVNQIFGTTGEWKCNLLYFGHWGSEYFFYSAKINNIPYKIHKKLNSSSNFEPRWPQ
jgi:hypothetical protein